MAKAADKREGVPAPTAALRVSADGYRRTFAMRTNTAGYAGLVLLVAGAGAEVAATLAIGGHPGPAAFVVATAVVLGVVLGGRALRLAVVVDGEQLIVRNWFRTHVIPVGEIKEFRPPKRHIPGEWKDVGMEIVRTRGLPVLYATTLYSTGFKSRSGTREAAELNHWLRYEAYRSPRKYVPARLHGWNRALWSVWVGFLVVWTILGLYALALAITDPQSMVK